MTFEEAFFGPGNRLRWGAIQAGTTSADVRERLGPFLDDLRRNPEMLVLPRVRDDDGRLQWYVLCSSARVARIVRDEIRAFLGPSYSDFEGRPIRLDPADPVEAAVVSRCGANAFRIEVPQQDLINAARERIRLAVRLRDERPVRHARRVRAAGRVLRDFEYALLTGDRQGAIDCIAELRSAGHLDATNLLFLEVRRLAAFAQWEAILALPELGSLLAMPRPRRVTEALIRAAYAVQLQEFEDGMRAAEAVDRFRSEVFPKFRDLYKSRAGLSGYAVDASFLLAAAISTAPRQDIAEAILASYPDDSPRRGYLLALGRLQARPSAGPIDPLLDARRAFADADVDRAYELAVALAPSFDRCALLLRCARDMGTLATARTALEAHEALPATERTRLDGTAVLCRIRDALLTLTAPPGQPPVEESTSSWSTWLRRLGVETPWRSAVAVAEAGAREWDIDTLTTNPVAVTEVADLILADRPAWGQAALRDALPHLLESCLLRGPDVRLRPIYESLFLAIAVDDQVSLPQIAALVRVAEARVQIGVAAEQYREIVRQLSSTMEVAESPAVADLALEALDGMVSTTCPDPPERQDYFVRVAALFYRWYRRIDASQWTLLRRLGDELGVPDTGQNRPPEDTSAEGRSPWDSLDGKRVAIYSLRESALRRAEAVLQELCPGARIDIFHDLVGGSAALRTASASADLFVLATAAAKHAATLFIESNRPRSRPTLYARGQGSASLLEAIREHLLRS